MQEFFVGDVYVTVDGTVNPPQLLSAYEGELMEFTSSDGTVCDAFPESCALDLQALTMDKGFIEDVEEELSSRGKYNLAISYRCEIILKFFRKSSVIIGRKEKLRRINEH